MGLTLWCQAWGKTQRRYGGKASNRRHQRHRGLHFGSGAARSLTDSVCSSAASNTVSSQTDSVSSAAPRQGQARAAPRRGAGAERGGQADAGRVQHETC